MAPRQTARRLLVAAPALALAAFAVTACSPPNEQPADPDAPYTLPTYEEEAGSTATDETTTAEETTPAEEAEDQTGTDGAQDGVEGADGEPVPGGGVEGGLEPGVEVPLEGEPAPFEGLPGEQPAP